MLLFVSIIQYTNFSYKKYLTYKSCIDYTDLWLEELDDDRFLAVRGLIEMVSWLNKWNKPHDW